MRKKVNNIGPDNMKYNQGDIAITPCAWISETEVIPFDNIDFTEIESANHWTITTVNRNTLDIQGEKNVKRFVEEYTNYLSLISRATNIIRDM